MTTSAITATPQGVSRNWYQISADVMSILQQGLAATAAATALNLNPKVSSSILIAMAMIQAAISKLSGYAKQQAIATAPNDPPTSTPSPTIVQIPPTDAQVKAVVQQVRSEAIQAAQATVKATA